MTNNTFCKNCEYFSGSIFCKSPENGISYIDGEPNSQFISISRNNSGHCGPEGKSFKQKTFVKQHWWRFWG